MLLYALITSHINTAEIHDQRPSSTEKGVIHAYEKIGYVDITNSCRPGNNRCVFHEVI